MGGDKRGKSIVNSSVVQHWKRRKEKMKLSLRLTKGGIVEEKRKYRGLALFHVERSRSPYFG